MGPITHDYALEVCDLTGTTARHLQQYRCLREQCMRDLEAVSQQLHDFAWDTTVFYTLYEAMQRKSRPRPNRTVLSLLVDGYVTQAVMCIRRMQDSDKRASSLGRVIDRLRAQPTLLTRAHFVCHDGLPYDYQSVQDKVWAEARVRGQTVVTSSYKGPSAYGASEQAHQRFDALCGRPAKRNPLDVIDPAILQRVSSELRDDPLLQRVYDLASMRYAHHQRMTHEQENELFNLKHTEIEQALKKLVVLTRFVSEELLNYGTFGQVVPTPQFDQLKHLDQGWTDSDSIEAVRAEWDSIANRLNDAAYEDTRWLLSPAPKAATS